MAKKRFEEEIDSLLNNEGTPPKEKRTEESGKAMTSILIDKSLFKELRLIALWRGNKIRSVVEEAFQTYIKKNKEAAFRQHVERGRCKTALVCFEAIAKKTSNALRLLQKILLTLLSLRKGAF